MSVFETVIGWLAPPACLCCGKEGSAICAGCAGIRIVPFDDRCWRCNRLSPGSKTCENCRRTGSPGRVWIVTNYESTARNLLSLYKFSQQRAAAEPIARFMADTFLKGADSVSVHKNYLVVPVPTSIIRVRERGFDHTDLLARQIALRLKLKKVNALRRLDHSRQLGSTREERLVQLSGSFAASPALVSGRDILLVDDVVTTGGSLIAAARTLRAAGAKSVDAVLFAKKL